MELSFVTLDVFTKKRFEGNPLAVVSVPASLRDKLTQEKRQKVAREFNLSETVFLHEPATDEKPTKLDINIFTIEEELPFAGHPTIGTAVLVKDQLYPSVDTLVIPAGPIALSTGGNGPPGSVRAKIPHNVHLHQKTLADVIPQDQHATYPGLSHGVPAIREAELRAPPVSIVKGMTFILVKLPSVELLGQVQPQRLYFDKLPAPLFDAEWAPTFASRYYYVEEGTGPSEAGASTRNVRARMLELGFEDPATGSAASTLAGYLTLSERLRELDLVVVQGVEMGRRSVIHVQTTADAEGDGAVKMKDLWLGGEAVVVQKGVITVD